MTNRNLKYRNGMEKRAAVRAVRARARSSGALTAKPEAAVAAALGFAPRFILDTNVFFAVIEYWADDLRAGLRDLVRAQPSLRLYLLDTVASECRGSQEKRALYDSIVYSGRNAAAAAVHPLATRTRGVAQTASALAAARPQHRRRTPSDLKDELIAACAVASGAAVVTCNGGDFAELAAVEPRLRFVALAGPAVERRVGELLLSYLCGVYEDRPPRA